MTKINNNSNVQATQNTNDIDNIDNIDNIDTKGDFKGKKITSASSDKKIESSKFKKPFLKSLFSRNTKKNTTERSQNSSQVKTSSEQKKNLATINNIEQAIKKYQEFHENTDTKKISNKTLELLQEAQNAYKTADEDKAKSKIKELLTSISTDLQYNKISTTDLKDFKNEYAKEAKKQQKQVNTLYKNTAYSESTSKLNDAIYNNSLKILLKELINFRNEAVNEITAEIKKVDKDINSLVVLHNTKSNRKLSETIEHKNELIAKLKVYNS